MTGARLTVSASSGSESSAPALREGFNAVVVGASGGIGGALSHRLGADRRIGSLFALSRTPATIAGARSLRVDIEDERSIEAAAAEIRNASDAVDLVVVASGLLHDGDAVRPEKSWRHLEAETMAHGFRINAIGPALIAKHFLPLLGRRSKAVFAALSARVGSIADNRLGGWHSYRASKAALNMLVRTLSVELSRENPAGICVALHPGTVATGLTAPFSKAGLEVQPPDAAAERLLHVIDGLRSSDTGGFFDQHGDPIAW